ncbi:MAG TPA: hypothetical protein VHG35_05800 [Gemmatimonadales bacterium]|nr:hypothetical protein [Gemmatimonadales bacterium]
MRRIADRRLQALLLTAVLLVGGSGISALDLVLYHLGGHVEAPASPRVAGTDAPRSHGDTCVLLDWTARGTYTLALDQLPTLPAQAGTTRTPSAPADVPRAVRLTASARSRAPPSQLT